MKHVFKICVALLSTLASTGQVSDSTQNLLDDAIHRAKVVTFYSATYSNGWDELQLAKAYTDTAENLLLLLDQENVDVSLSREVINGLRDEHEVSRSISEDNINYIYPVSSLMSGHRDDFVVQDDAEELLVEALIEKVLSQNDPLNKGKIEENINFLVFQIKPYDRTHLLVASDYLATKTGHYVIRHHEFAEILGKEGLKRFENDQLTNEDWSSICDYYGIDKLLNLKVVDQNPQISGLSYKGIILNSVHQGRAPEYVSYFEGFKVDKISSWDYAIILSILNTLLTGLLLLMLGSVSISKSGFGGFRFGSYAISFAPDRQVGVLTAMMTLIPLFTIVGVNYISTSLAPEINAYFKSPEVIIWVVFQSVVPFLASVVITYLALFKVPHIVVNNAKGFSRILFGSWMGQLTVLSFYEYHCELFPSALFGFVDFVPAISLIFVCSLLGVIIDKTIKKEPLTVAGKLFAFLSILLAILSFWLELHEWYLLGNIFYGILGATSLYLLNNKSVLSGNLALNSKGHAKELRNLINPLRWYTAGTNLKSVKTDLRDFLIQSQDKANLALLRGHLGSGKTRLLNELVLEISDSSFTDVIWFQGDCNFSTDTAQREYEPFYEAFSLKGNLLESSQEGFNPLVPEGFFADRTRISKAFNEVMSRAGSVAPVDLTQMLSIDDDSARTQDEIANELLDIIINRYLSLKANVVVLVIDDIHFIDASSLELLKTFISEIEKRRQHQESFKFVFTTTLEHEKRAREILEELSEEKDGNLSEYQIRVESIADFTSELLSDEYFNYDSAQGHEVPYRFDSKIKGHLREVISSEKNKLMPKDILSYLENISHNGYLYLDGDVYRLKETPTPGEIDILDSRSHVRVNGLGELSRELRSLLESAAVVGYRFDADMLAHIWNEDLLKIISQLELLEGIFIKDLSDRDNMYSFTSKVLHRKVLELANENSEFGHSRQLIIEYQKRIINSILAKGASRELENFDLEMLRSAAERCFKYSHVEMINLHMAEIVLIAAKKLATEGKRQQSAHYLERLYKKVEEFKAGELLLLSEVLVELTKNDRSTELFEFTSARNSHHFLDEILLSARFVENEASDYHESPLARISIVAMGGIMQGIRLRRYTYSEIKGSESSEDERINMVSKRFKFIKALLSARELKSSKAIVRLEFYEALMRKENGVFLVDCFKDALSVNYPKLAGEIARQISLDINVPKESRLKYLMASLKFLNGVSLNLNEFERLDTDDANLKRSIEGLIQSKKLTSSEAQDLNFLLSRIREHFMEVKDLSYVLTLSELSLTLSSQLGDSRGITFSLSYTGAVLHKLNRFDDSLQVYKEYGEHLLRINAPKHDFYYALEGLLRNSIVLKDPATVKALLSDIKANGVQFTEADYQEPLRFSLIDSSSDLSSLFKEWNSML